MEKVLQHGLFSREMKMLVLWTILAIIFLANSSPDLTTPATPKKYPEVPQDGAIVHFKGLAYFVQGKLRVEMDSTEHLYVKKSLQNYILNLQSLNLETKRNAKFFGDNWKKVQESLRRKIKHHLNALMNRLSTDFFYSVDGNRSEAKIIDNWISVTDTIFANSAETESMETNFFDKDKGEVSDDLFHPSGVNSSTFWNETSPSKKWQLLPPDMTIGKSKREVMPLDFIGDSSNLAFGTARVKDVNILRDFLETGMSHIGEKNKKIIDHVNALTSSIESLLNHMSKMVGKGVETNDKMKKHKGLRLLILQWQEALRMVRFLIHKQHSAEHRDQLISTEETKAELTVNQFKILIKKGEQIFKPFVFLGEIDPNLPSDQKIRIPGITVERTSQTSDTIVIPFVDLKEKVKLYELEPFPFVTNDGHKRVPNLDKTIALTQEEYTIIQDSAKCDLVGEFYLCDKNHWKFPMSIPNCSVGYITGDRIMMSEKCRLKKPKMMVTEMFAVTFHDYVYVFFPNVTSTTITCPSNMTTTTKTEKLTQTVVFGKFCNMDSQYGSYRHPQISFDKFQSNVHVFPVQPINFTFLNDEARERELLRQRLEEGKREFKKLIEEAESLGVNHFFDPISFVKFSWKLSSAASTVLIVALLGFMFYKCIKSK